MSQVAEEPEEAAGNSVFIPIHFIGSQSSDWQLKVNTSYIQKDGHFTGIDEVGDALELDSSKFSQLLSRPVKRPALQKQGLNNFPLAQPTY